VRSVGGGAHRTEKGVLQFAPALWVSISLGLWTGVQWLRSLGEHAVTATRDIPSQSCQRCDGRADCAYDGLGRIAEVSATVLSAVYDECWAVSVCGCDWHWGVSVAPQNVVVDDRLASDPLNNPSALPHDFAHDFTHDIARDFAHDSLQGSANILRYDRSHVISQYMWLCE
jgi:hypothetical protein